MARIIVKITRKKDGLPVTDAKVLVQPEGENEIAPTKAGGGEYTFEGLKLVKHTIKVEAPGGFKAPNEKTKTLKKEDDAPEVLFELEEANGGGGANGDGTGSIAGRVTDSKLAGVAGVTVLAKDPDDENIVGQDDSKGKEGKYEIAGLPPGTYKVAVKDAKLPERLVAVSANKATGGIDFSENPAEDFFELLEDDLDYSIEPTISVNEANEAIRLFSVVNIMLAGLSERRTNGETKTDLLGMLNLYYGLGDKSLVNTLVFADPDDVWNAIGGRLTSLAQALDSLQSDVGFLRREAKRQFNLGVNTEVVGNAQFPAWFRRYVEIGTDPLLAVDLKKADEPGSFFDKAKLAQAYDLLAELKRLLVQMVRSLSKTGTSATEQVNTQWASFESESLEVLSEVAKKRVSPDEDEKTPWAVLAALTGKNRDTEIAPYVALARHGGRLLRVAMEVYNRSRDRLEDYTRDHLLSIFQQGDAAQWLTTLIREHAAIVARYQLTAWR